MEVSTVQGIRKEGRKEGRKALRKEMVETGKAFHVPLGKNCNKCHIKLAVANTAETRYKVTAYKVKSVIKSLF